MNQHQTLRHHLALAQVEGIGGTLHRLLVHHFKEPALVWKAKPHQWRQIYGIGDTISLQLKREAFWLEQADRILDAADKQQVQIASYQCVSYPNRLGQIPDAPAIIYWKGDLHGTASKTIAVVGTRKSTEYGKRWVQSWMPSLAAHHPVVISGLALGIDTLAHQSALKHHLPTLAVMANGLDMVYPAHNKKLAQQIIEQGGGLVSENPLGMKPMASLFIARNRIIAGLSDVCVLVESAIRGGGMVTADFAFQYDRAVMAVPGSLWSPQSEGPHALIKQQKAQILTDLEDIWTEVAWPKEVVQGHLFQPTALSTKNEFRMDLLTAIEKNIVQVLKEKGEVQIDQLAFDTQLSLNQLASTLLQLEFQGILTIKPGKKVRLTLS